ncbi:MAG: hypothetical protein IKN66_07420 [Ruminococcus sp.]|nr:hypothetical protein [Ruminococcus sp.]
MKCETCGSELSGMMPTCPFCGTPDPAYMRRYGLYPPQGGYQPPRMNYPPPPQGSYPPPPQQGSYPPPYMYRRQPFDPANEPPEVGIIVFSVLIPLAGFIYGIASLSGGEKRAGKAYLLAAGLSLGVSLLLVLIAGLIGVMSASNR